LNGWVVFQWRFGESLGDEAGGVLVKGCLVFWWRSRWCLEGRADGAWVGLGWRTRCSVLLVVLVMFGWRAG